MIRLGEIEYVSHAIERKQSDPKLGLRALRDQMHIPCHFIL